MSTELLKVNFRTELKDAEVTEAHKKIIIEFASSNQLSIDDKHVTGYLDKFGNVSAVVKYDGWIHLLNKTDSFDGIKFKYSESKSVVPATIKTVYDWIECVIYRKDREHPIVVREHFSDLFAPEHDYWERPNRVMRQIALSECARVAFGISGIRDEYSLPSLESVTSKRTNVVSQTFEKPVRVIDVASPTNNVVSINAETAIVATTTVKSEIDISEEEKEPIDVFLSSLTRHPAAFATPQTIIDQLSTRFAGVSLQYAVKMYESALEDFKQKSGAQQ